MKYSWAEAFAQVLRWSRDFPERLRVRRQHWRFQKYDVAPRLGLRTVERRLREAVRQEEGLSSGRLG
jgi:hypothetical protein